MDAGPGPEAATTPQVEATAPIPSAPADVQPVPGAGTRPSSGRAQRTERAHQGDETMAVAAFPPVRVPVTGQAPIVPTMERPQGSGGRRNSGRRLTVLVIVLAAIVLVGAAVGATYAVTSKNSHAQGAATTTTRPHSTSTTVNSLNSTGSRHSAGYKSSSGSREKSTTTTTSTGNERSAATALSALLSQSVADRSEINSASEDVAACGPTLGKDAATFQAAATSRQELLAQLSTLPSSSTLPPQLIQTLTSAWNASEQVDDDYAQWASSDEVGGCTPGGTTNPYFQAAETPNTQATQAKQSVANLWNSIAQMFNLPTYQWDQL